MSERADNLLHSSEFLDSHCHLDGADFETDREAVIERARAAGVKIMMAIGGGSGPDELSVSVPIAQAHEGIYAAVGVHPHEAKKVEERHYDVLRAAAAQPKVLAIGEIGLDYFYNHSPRDIQQRVLIRQLELAREVKRPIVIHCRDAWEDLRRVIGEHWKASGLGGILHCFTGDEETALAFIGWGFLISFAGNITFKKADNLRDAARRIPRDRLLTETDCPYLAPVPHRGQRNEPAFVCEVTRQLAALQGVGEEEMARAVMNNFVQFFRLA